jgi:hypothetical protein
MPSNIDKAFIDNLQNFTDALEGIVELMQQQNEKGGDAINEMLSAMDGPKMSEIAEDIKTLVEKTDKIDTRTKKILEEVKATRKAKESGMFGKISDKSNKEKIVDGVSVIMLIAGGVLAIGMAFKIIGDVDVMSVIALGIAIYAISKAFAEIAEIEDLTPKKAITTGLVMVAIAGALVASSFILKFMQPIDIFTAFSLVLVGGTLGLAAFLLLKSVEKISLKPKDIVSILLLPLVLPIIAGAIVASSFLIKFMQPIDLQKGISFALLGGALGFAAFLLIRSIGKTDLSKNIKNILLLPLVLPIISGAIVLSSLILQLFQPLKDPLNFIASAAAIGLGIIMFLPVFVAISKLKLTNPVQLLMGGLAIVIVSTAIMLSSWILSVGNYEKYPSAKWSLGAGLSMILFLPSLVVFGVLAMSGIGLAALALGAVGALITAATIVGVSHVLNEGSYNQGPPLDWALGVSVLLPIFGASMVALALIPFAGKLLDRGANMVLTVADTIVTAADILRGGSYTGGPSKEWAEGIGLSLGAFADALGVALKGGGGLFSKGMKPDEFVDFIRNVSYGMIEAADILSQGNWSQNAPSKEWGEGVGASLSPFIELFSTIASSPKARMLMKDLKKSNKKDEDSIFVDFVKDVAWAMVSVNNIFDSTDWKGYPTPEWGEGVKKAFDVVSVIGGTDSKIIDGIDKFAEAIKKLSRSFNSLRNAGIDKFGKLTGSITILSAVDQNQLNNVIGVLDANKDRLADVTRKAGSGTIGTPQGLKNVQEKVQTAVNKAIGKDLTPGEKMLSDKFDEVLEKFDEVLDNMVKSGQGKDAGEKDKATRG